jgi:hypothetical protein
MPRDEAVARATAAYPDASEIVARNLATMERLVRIAGRRWV